MKWIEVQVRVPNEASEALSAVVLEWPEVQGVSVEGFVPATPPHGEYGEWFDESLLDTDQVTLRFYVPEPARPEEVRLRTLEALRRVSESGLPLGDASENLTATELDEESWANAWKEDYHPFPIGDRLVIVPEWDAASEELAAYHHRIPILVEPGMAFGTGTHQTTQLCLKALEDLVASGDAVLDVGCGTAILAIAAAKLGATRVRAVDIDPVAVRVAEANIETNAVSEQVMAEVDDLAATGGAHVPRYRIVVANILRDIVIGLMPAMVAQLVPKGRILLSGFVTTQVDMVKQAMHSCGLRVVEEREQDDWVMLMGEKV